MFKSYVRLLNLTFLGSLILPILVYLCQRTIHWSNTLVAYLFLSISVFVLWKKYFQKVYPGLEKICSKQGAYLDSLPTHKLKMGIFISASASLFLELAIIRWQGTTFPIFAFYKNYSLLICFAGLGIGYSLAKRDSIPLIFSIPVFGFQFLLLKSLSHIQSLTAIRQAPFQEQLSMGLMDTTPLSYFIASYSFLTIVFLLTLLALLPIGQLCGRLMSRSENLKAYGLNLLGSVLGVVLLSGISFFWTPPSIWFCIAFAVIITFLQFDSRALFLGVLASFAAFIVLEWPASVGVEKIYSPYQLLERGVGDHGLTSLKAAGLYYQRIHDLSPTNANRLEDPKIKSIMQYYDLPYQIYGKKPEKVAIVGSGTGNDVAAALRGNAEHIDAIEIDPAILEMGHQYHPEKPYNDPRVTPIVNDARTFMRSTTNKYDMIVYGLLDSHTLLSHASSVRLDSFVYTVEALREARAHLKKGGILSLSFCVLSKEIGRKIFLMLTEAFDGKPPVSIFTKYDVSVIFLQSEEGAPSIKPELLSNTGFENVTSIFNDPSINADVSTDDWPFFYMPHRIYPTSYLLLMGLILLVSLFAVNNFFEQKPGFSQITFFLLGGGFMLIETRAITELGLVFGNTWHVIGVVISGILLMAFLANVFIQKIHLKGPLIPFIFLFISLLVGYFISRFVTLNSSQTDKLLTVILLTCPMFFSGMVFSSLLKQTKNIADVMAANLLGGMVGGILEYNSMYFGFRFLYLLAAVLYLLAFGTCYFIPTVSAKRAK